MARACYDASNADDNLLKSDVDASNLSDPSAHPSAHHLTHLRCPGEKALLPRGIALPHDHRQPHFVLFMSGTPDRRGGKENRVEKDDDLILPPITSHIQSRGHAPSASPSILDLRSRTRAPPPRQPVEEASTAMNTAVLSGMDRTSSRAALADATYAKPTSSADLLKSTQNMGKATQSVAARTGLFEALRSRETAKHDPRASLNVVPRAGPTVGYGSVTGSAGIASGSGIGGNKETFFFAPDSIQSYSTVINVTAIKK